MSSSLISRVVLRASALNAARCARMSRTVSPVVAPMPTWTRAFVTISPATLAPAKTTTAKSKASPTGKKAATPKMATTPKRKTAASKKPTRKPAKKAAKKPVKKAATKKATELKPSLVYRRNKPPKRPTTHPYSVFFGEYMKEALAGKSIKPSLVELGRASGDAWKTLSDSEKQRFVVEAEKVNAERLEAWQIYQKTLDPKVKRVVNAYLSDNQKRKIPGSDRKLTNYAQFVKDEASSVQLPTDVDGLSAGRHIFRTLSERWKAMSDLEKKVYSDRAAKEMAERMAERTQHAKA